MKQLILSGGGDAPDSKKLDTLLIKLLNHKPLLYIPVAWKTGDFESCIKWFTQTFSALGFTSFETWTDLTDKNYEQLDKFGGIYFGGGNTFLLLSKLRESGFDKALYKFIESGRPVYGGSAGAIILGKDIATASIGKDSDSNDIGLENLSGFGLLDTYSIQCHYEPDQEDEMQKFVNENNCKVIALPDKAGLYVKGDEIKVLGTEPAVVFCTNDEKRVYRPEMFFNLK